MKHIRQTTCTAFILFLFIQGSGQTLFPYKQTDTLPGLQDKSLTISNPSGEKTNIQFAINGRFWFSKSDILNSVAQTSVDSIANVPYEILQAWGFVMKNTLHYKDIPLNKAYAYHAQTLLNSFGGGFCSHRNTLLAQIWEWQGYTSRLVLLEGHLIPEVLVQGHWLMFDADFNCCFSDVSGHILGYRELEKGFGNTKMNSVRDIRSLMNTLLKIYAGNYQSFFLTPEDNKVSDWYKHNIAETGNWFEMPGHSYLNISSLMTDPELPYSSAEFVIQGNFTGFVRIPFAVYESDAEITHPNLLPVFHQKEMNPPGLYFLSGNNIKLRLYVNPLFSTASGRTIVNVRKNKNIDLSLETNHCANRPNPFLYTRKKISSIPDENIREIMKATEIPGSIHIETRQDYIRTCRAYIKQPYADSICKQLILYSEDQKDIPFKVFNKVENFTINNVFLLSLTPGEYQLVINFFKENQSSPD